MNKPEEKTVEQKQKDNNENGLSADELDQAVGGFGLNIFNDILKPPVL